MSTDEMALAVRRSSSASDDTQLAASAGRSANQQGALAVAILGPKIEPFLQDPAVDQVAQFMFSIASFMVSYQQCQKYFDEKDEKEPLKPVAGKDLPQELQDDTLKSLGEKMFLKLDNRSHEFCHAWCIVQDLLTKDGLAAAFEAIDMQETLNEDSSQPDAPLAAKELLALLNAKKINKAVNSLQINDNGSVTMGQMFLMQMNNRQQSSGKANALMDAITKSTKDLQNIVKKREALEIEKAGHDAAVEDGKTKKAKMDEMARNNESISTYLKNALKDAKAELAKWESALKWHTYRMFPPYEAMWRNDVALDKEKVNKYQLEVQRIEEQIREWTEEKSKSIQKEIDATNTKQIKEAEKKSELASENIEISRKNIKSMEKKLAVDQAKLERVVQQEGKYSVEHLLQANEAKNLLAVVTSQSESTADVFASGWERPLAELSILMCKCLEAKKLSSQKKILGKLQDHLRSDRPLFNVLRNSRPVMSLMPSVVGQRPRYQPQQLVDAIDIGNGGDNDPSPEVHLIPYAILDNVESAVLLDELKMAMETEDLDSLHKAIANAKAEADDAKLQEEVAKAQKDAEARSRAIDCLAKAIAATDVDALAEEIKKTKEEGIKVSIVKAEAELNRRRTALTEISNAMQSPSEETALLEAVLDKNKQTKLPPQEFEKVRKELAERKQRAAAQLGASDPSTSTDTASAIETSTGTASAIGMLEFQPLARAPAPQAPLSNLTPAPVNGMDMMGDDDDDETEGL